MLDKESPDREGSCLITREVILNYADNGELEVSQQEGDHSIQALGLSIPMAMVLDSSGKVANWRQRLAGRLLKTVLGIQEGMTGDGSGEGEGKHYVEIFWSQSHISW